MVSGHSSTIEPCEIPLVYVLQSTNDHVALVRAIRTLMLLLWIMTIESSFAQLGLVEWQETFDSRCALADFELSKRT